MKEKNREILKEKEVNSKTTVIFGERIQTLEIAKFLNLYYL